jgi:hypothetical protein
MVAWQVGIFKPAVNCDTASFAGVTSIGFLALMWEFQSFFITLLDRNAASRLSHRNTPAIVNHFSFEKPQSFPLLACLMLLAT